MTAKTVPSRSWSEPMAALTTETLTAEARAVGFHRVGVVPVAAAERHHLYETWLAEGMHGEMAFMARPEAIEARRDVRALLREARSMVVCALSYGDSGNLVPLTRKAPRGIVARYARGGDYHHLLKEKLHALARRVSQISGRAVAARPCVDSAPVLEREAAHRSGIGFVAKNTMLIAPGLGSYTVLGELLLDIELPTEAPPPSASRCGQCRACLDACPTGAFRDAYVLDARRCISYLTIEHRGVIPRDLRAAMGVRVFGCDICQEVCPFNARAPQRTPPAPELAPRGDLASGLDLFALARLSASGYRKLVKGSALRRASRPMLARNACIALGNAGDRRAIPVLVDALSDRSALVRGHAAWALGRLGETSSLEAALASEADPYVREELLAALSPAQKSAPRAR